MFSSGALDQRQLSQMFTLHFVKDDSNSPQLHIWELNVRLNFPLVVLSIFAPPLTKSSSFSSFILNLRNFYEKKYFKVIKDIITDATSAITAQGTAYFESFILTAPK